MLTPAAVTPARLPHRLLARGLRYIFYTALVLFSFSFLLGSTTDSAHAADPLSWTEITITTLSDGNSVSLPTNHGTYTANIDWGDGTALQAISNAAPASHTYGVGTTGAHLVKIEPLTGTFTQFGNGGAVWPGLSAATYLTGVSQIGNTITSLSGAFYQAVSLSAFTAPLPASVNDLSYAFYGDTSFNSSFISTWATGNVLNFTSMFQGCLLYTSDAADE